MAPKKPSIDITIEVGGKETDVAHPGDLVRLRAEVSDLELTEQHAISWQLPGKARILAGGELLRKGDPHVIESFWSVGNTKPGTYELSLEILDADGAAVAPPATTVFTIAPSTAARAKGAFQNIGEALQGGGTPGETLRDVIGEAAAIGGEVIDALHETTRTGAAMINAAHDIKRMRGDLPPIQVEGAVSLQRTSIPPTADAALWLAIKKGAEAIAFPAYKDAIDSLVCASGDGAEFEDTFRGLARRRFLPFNDTDAYRFLKVATEAFLLANVGSELDDMGFSGSDLDLAEGRLEAGVSFDDLNSYLVNAPGRFPGKTLPYLAIVLRNMGDTRHRSSLYEKVERTFSSLVGATSHRALDEVRDELCAGVTVNKINAPLFLELIWSYWQEEGMLVQTMNAISRRFQNVRAPGSTDPLAALEMNPLRPLNNVLWGYIQDEQHRLSVARRAYEYDHHYGISLHGKAISDFRPADSRSRFIEAFHTLLAITADFYRQDDDTTVKPDGFQVMNAITEVHFVLSQGAHNQFGDLPSTARQEMLIQQWLLSRPELAEFLPSRAMVAYPEPWMHRVEAMKTIQGWTDASVLHFNRLAAFGEQILLSIRYGAWSTVNNPAQASTWARFWRPEIQGYIHAYRAVTGVDLVHDTSDATILRERMLQPAVHLRRRLEQQRVGAPAPMRATVSPMLSKTATRR